MALLIQSRVEGCELKFLRQLSEDDNDSLVKDEKGLRDLERLRLSAAKSNVDPTYWISAAIVDPLFGMDKEELSRQFAEYQIDMRPLFYPISAMPPFQPYVKGKIMKEVNPITHRLSDYGLCLPNGNNVTEEDVRHICDSFKSILDTTCLTN